MTTTHRSIALLAALAAVSISAAPAAAQAAKQVATKHAAPTPAKHETAAQLRAEAKISESAARATALSQVPNGKVKQYELEREKGKLLYSYDIVAPGKSGVDEVQVDAINGTVLSNVHETPAMERKEASAEAKEAKAGKHAWKKGEKQESKKP